MSMLGLSAKDVRSYWTIQEVEVLRRLAKTINELALYFWYVIANKIGRSAASVYIKLAETKVKA